MATRTQKQIVEKLVSYGADLQLTSFWSTGPGKNVYRGRENINSMREDETEIMIAELRSQIADPATTRVMCCSACGDDIPCIRTPRGWLCHDCAADL